VKELKRVQLTNRPIYIEDIGKVAGVSGRAIFQASKETYSCSPMAYVKSVRIKQARRLLHNPDDTTTVTGIAFLLRMS
jgi:AraC-like DNA-binding protein